MPSKSLFLADLVRDSRIETTSSDSYIQHVFHETERSAGERLLLREERWERLKPLGKGTYGRVYLEKRVDEGCGELRAVKEIKKFVVGQELDDTQELEVIMKFSDPNYEHWFVGSRGWYELGDFVFITMEFLELGNLQQYLKHPLPESETRQIVKQALEGLDFLHGNGFIHRDLKPTNIMVVTKGPEWFVKITDFGVSQRRQQQTINRLDTHRGDLSFAAPEAIGLVPNSTYSFASDMWSLGAIAYRILTRTTAFEFLGDLVQYTNGMSQLPEDARAWNAVSDHGRDFIVKLMQVAPMARLTVELALKHDWMTANVPIPAREAKQWRPYKPTSQEPGDNAGISAASKASSYESPTHLAIPKTNQPTALASPSRSGYVPPFVSDCPEEPDPSHGPSLPADPDILRLAVDETQPSSPGNQAEQVQEAPIVVPISSSIGLGDRSSRIPQPSSTCYAVVDVASEAVHLTPRYTSEDYLDTFADLSEPTTTDEIGNGAAAESSQQPTRPKTPSSDGYDSEDDDAPESVVSFSSSYQRPEILAENPKPRPQGYVRCDRCNCASKAVKYLPCSHSMCHACLLELFALSLVSPSHMPPRCCRDGSTEINVSAFDRLIIPDPRINIAWNTYKEQKATHGTWSPVGCEHSFVVFDFVVRMRNAGVFSTPWAYNAVTNAYNSWENMIHDRGPGYQPVEAVHLPPLSPDPRPRHAYQPPAPAYIPNYTQPMGAPTAFPGNQGQYRSIITPYMVEHNDAAPWSPMNGSRLVICHWCGRGTLPTPLNGSADNGTCHLCGNWICQRCGGCWRRGTGCDNGCTNDHVWPPASSPYGQDPDGYEDMEYRPGGNDWDFHPHADGYTNRRAFVRG